MTKPLTQARSAAMLTLWGLVMVVVLVLVAAGLAWLTRDPTIPAARSAPPCAA